MICPQCGIKMDSLGTIDDTWREYKCRCGYEAMRHIHHRRKNSLKPNRPDPARQAEQKE